jgi:hypothetical protein
MITLAPRLKHHVTPRRDHPPIAHEVTLPAPGRTRRKGATDSNATAAASGADNPIGSAPTVVRSTDYKGTRVRSRHSSHKRILSHKRAKCARFSSQDLHTASSHAVANRLRKDKMQTADGRWCRRTASGNGDSAKVTEASGSNAATKVAMPQNDCPRTGGQDKRSRRLTSVLRSGSGRAIAGLGLRGGRCSTGAPAGQYTVASRLPASPPLPPRQRVQENAFRRESDTRSLSDGQ